VFQAYPQCFAMQQKLLCGLSCDPRQSEYVRYNGGVGNTSATFFIWYAFLPLRPVRLQGRG
jgi:hypothetical protein